MTVEVFRIGKINVTSSTDFTHTCASNCPTIGTVINGATSCTTDCNGVTNYHQVCMTSCITNCTLPPVHWKLSTAIAISSIASFLSYSLMTCLILIPLNSYRKRTNNEDRDDDTNSDAVVCTTHRKASKNTALFPFDDSDQSSKLSPIETLFFFLNYLLMHILLVCSFGVSVYYVIFTYHLQNHQGQTLYNLKSCWINIFNIARIFLHLSSHFCAIQSCFIFSKIVYKVTNKLEQLATDIDRVNFEGTIQMVNDATINELFRSGDKEKVDKGRYILLQKLDQEFIKKVAPTLDLFGLWFIFHWVSFALTTMLLTGYILEILMYIDKHGTESIKYSTLIPGTCTECNIVGAYILYIVFFTLIHFYLFLYPCFHASAIAAARAKLMHKISKKRWINVTPSLQNNFTQYLTAQNFAFRVPLLCATISFDFNWVYVSFFIAICAIYLEIQ